MNFEVFWVIHNDVTQLSVYQIISCGFNLEILNKDSWESFLSVTINSLYPNWLVMLNRVASN